ncbi:hypothetical protein [Streptomyces sp. NPDC045470]|uniref:hypothetical protein n=1 Tax=Streptomyces sp. NPDC045470 TaxID=3155469 RepID=UPI0033E534D3
MRIRAISPISGAVQVPALNSPRRRRAVHRSVAVVLALGAMTLSSGTASAFGPDAHYRAVNDSLGKEIDGQTRRLLRKAVMASDHRPYWSDGYAHCDDFDHFGYRHDYRVRDFELKTPDNVREDTSEEVRRWGKYYSRFPASGRLNARTASDRNLFGCLQYAFDRVNLAVYLARDLLDGEGKPRKEIYQDVACQESGTSRAGRVELRGGRSPRSRPRPDGRPQNSAAGNPNFIDTLKKNPKCNVIEQFGRSLHAIQDFYAHSNWADSEITTNLQDAKYKENIGTPLNPKGMKHTTPFPLFDFARLGVRPVDYAELEERATPRARAAKRIAPWRYFPPKLEHKEKSALFNPGQSEPFHVARFEQFSRQYLRAHRNTLPLDEKRYRDLQSGCYTEQTLIGNRICYEDKQLGHYPHTSNARWFWKNNKWHLHDWALSGGFGGLAKDTLTWTTDRAAAKFKTGELPAKRDDAEEEGSNFANSLNVATADTTRQWTYLKALLTTTYGAARATTMVGILHTDQKPLS